MRLFAALDLDHRARARLAEVAAELSRIPGLKWSRPESLHVTLRFFGEWLEDRLAELTAVLEGVERPGAPIEVRLERLGFLPGEREPRLVVAVGPTPKPLAEFQGRIEEAARELGFAPEKRVFLTHVTLARVRDPLQGKKLVVAVRRRQELDAAFAAGRWALYRSELTPGGARYTKLAEWPLT